MRECEVSLSSRASSRDRLERSQQAFHLTLTVEVAVGVQRLRARADPRCKTSLVPAREAMAHEGFAKLLDVASGSLTFGEIVGEGAEVVSRLGPSM